MSVIGIDFGNQNAVVAAAGRGGVDVILNGNSNRLNANLVSFSDSRSMGEAASATYTSNFLSTVSNLKRLVGLAYNDPRAIREYEHCPFPTVPITHPNAIDTIGVKVQFHNEEKIVPIEAVVGMMVKHCGSLVAAKNAEKGGNICNDAIDDPSSNLFPRDIVIAIPGYYTDAQRRAFLTGCAIVGIHSVQRLMHESTATALAYGIFKDIRKVFTKDKPEHVMFCDLGATSFSVTIVSFEPGKLSVKTSQYDCDLGGRGFDWVIASYLAGEFESQYKGKLSSHPKDKPKVWLKLLQAAERAKKTLSPVGVKEARISMECLMDDFDFNIRLSSEQFKTLCEPLLERLEAPITRALAEAKMTTSDLHSIEIVGGGTRVGSVKRMLSKVLKLDVSKPNYGLSSTMNADEAVARGAALQSAILSPRFKVQPYDIVEYQPIPVKVAWDGDNNGQGMEVEGTTDSSTIPTNSVVMFDRGSNFNVVRRVTLRRAGDFNVSASYDESATEYELPCNISKEVVSFVVHAPKGETEKIRVNIKQDLNGVISLCSAQMMEEVWEDVEVPVEPEKKEQVKVEKKEESKVEKKEDKKEESGDTKQESKAAESDKNPAGDEPKKQDENAKPDPAKEDAKPKETPPEPPKTKMEKRKKLKRTNLTFSETRPLLFTQPELDKAYEQEVAMTNIDRIVQETADKRNELESYIYNMRDKILSDSALRPYMTGPDQSDFSTLLENTENWLYEDGFDATKSVYAEKCTELQKLGDPVESRQREAIDRPGALSSLQGTIDHYGKWINTSTTDEQYAHITTEEIEKCRKQLDETSKWMYAKLDEQGMKPLYEPPVMTVNDLNFKRTHLATVINPIMTKPKPAPKVEEKKVEEKAADTKKETANTESTTEPNAKPTDMDTDSTTQPPPNSDAPSSQTQDSTSSPMDTSV